MENFSLIPPPKAPEPKKQPDRYRAIKITAAVFTGVVVAVFSTGAWLTVTASGHRFVEKTVRTLTDGEVQISHLQGNLISNLYADSIRLTDKDGVYLRVTQLRLSWNALALLRDHVSINYVSAARIQFLRSPKSESEESGNGPYIHIEHVDVNRIDVAKTVLGQEAHLTLHGKLNYTNAKNFNTDIIARQLDGDGNYRIALHVKHGWPEGIARIRENSNGFAGALAGMPDIGAVNLDLNAKAKGTQDLIRLKFSAGSLQMDATGQVDLKKKRMALSFHATSPEMHPRKDLSWLSLKTKGRINGKFSAPQITADLDITGLSSGTTEIRHTVVQLTTANNKVNLNGRIAGLNLPGDEDRILAAAPIHIHADADFNRKQQPVSFQIRHPLFRLTGNGRISDQHIQAELSIPELAPLSALSGTPLNGKARLHLEMNTDDDIRQLHASGKISAVGKALADRLLGADAHIEADYVLSPSLSRLTAELSGKALTTRIEGTERRDSLDYQAKIHLRDAARISPALAGNARILAHLTGPADALRLTLSGSGDVGAKGAPGDHLKLTAHAVNLSEAPKAEVKLNGWFDNAPLQLQASLSQKDKKTSVQITRGTWRSLRASGQVQIIGGKPGGRLQLAIGDLSDIADFTGSPLQGAAEVNLSTDNSGTTRLNATVRNFVSGETRIKDTTLTGTLQRLKSGDRIKAELTAKEVRTADMHGDISASIYGPLSNIGTAIQASFTTHAGRLELNTQLQTTPDLSRVHFETLQAKWNGKLLELAEPSEILRTENGIETGLTITDRDHTRLEISGQIPQNPGQSFALRIMGRADLSKWTDALSAQGRSLQGMADIYARISGSSDAPNIVGSAHLKDGKIYDVSSGLRLHDINAAVQANGNEILLKSFTAKAHGGKISGSGTISTAGNVPVNLKFHAKDARPFSRDGFSIAMDGDVTLSGDMKGAMRVSGKLHIDKGEIRLPDKMPPAIATLDVRRPGTKEAPPPSASRIALNISITSPGQFFVRGHGLEAELAGTISVDGSSNMPQLHGKLEMRRGTYSMAGTSLNFTSGAIDFEGSNSSGEIDPALDFTAESETSSVTATLNITGTARKPQIELSSSPTMPQDEILSQLLFQQSMDQLSPLQLAQIAQALVSLSGLDGGINPVEIARSSLKLDRLQFSSTPDSTGSDASDTTVEAGKYVMSNVYVGAKQSLSGGTRAQVQVDINRHFKIEGSIATDSGSSAVPTTINQDTGDTVGLSYQFEY